MILCYVYIPKRSICRHFTRWLGKSRINDLVPPCLVLFSTIAHTFHMAQPATTDIAPLQERLLGLVQVNVTIRSRSRNVPET